MIIIFITPKTIIVLFFTNQKPNNLFSKRVYDWKIVILSISYTWHIWTISTREKHIRCFNFQLLHCMSLLLSASVFKIFYLVSFFYEQRHKNTSSSTFSHFLLFPQASVDLRMYFRPPEHSLKHQIKSGIILLKFQMWDYSVSDIFQVWFNFIFLRVCI